MMKINLKESELQQVIDSLDHNGKDAPNELKKQLEERMADYKHDEKIYNEWYKASEPLFNTIYHWNRETPDDNTSKDYIDGYKEALFQALALTYPYSLGNSNNDWDEVHRVYSEWKEENKRLNQ
jgi:hypothetical protein